MSWQLLMVLQNTFAAVFAINSRHIARRFHHAALPLNTVIYAVIALSGLVYVLTGSLAQVSLTSFEHFAAFFIFAGLCFALTNILSFIVFQYVDAAIATLLATCNILASVLFATLLLHEGLTIRQLLGGLILLLSMCIVLTIRVSAYHHKRLWLGVMLSVVAGLFFGLAAATEKYLLNHVNIPTYLTFGWSLQFLAILTVSVLFGRGAQADFKLLARPRFWRWALLAGGLRMVSGLLFVFSLRLSNNLSIISVFSGLKVLLAALFAAYILQERDHLLRKYKAAIVAVAGIAIMLWK